MLFSTNLFATVYTEKDGLFFYFPEDEKVISARLTEKASQMVDFLNRKGLEIKPPLHIILDSKMDVPRVGAHVIPHSEIRIPIRAPGVLEDGYTENDPWSYFLFKGLCLQGIYGIRSGIPGTLHKIFGDIISPNAIIPQWMEEGICSLLYSLYADREISDPFESSLFNATQVPSLDLISHHPQVWPGYNGYRIYGKPFLFWLYRKFGWAKILEFLQVHGHGIIPIEIDLKALKVFGKTGAGLWRDFQSEFEAQTVPAQGLLITGYWEQPFVYWNRAGVFPGKVQTRHRGRYGYAEPDGTLWVSEYQNASKIYRYAKGTVFPTGLIHVWDPGPGRVMITRTGHQPWVAVVQEDGRGGFRLADASKKEQLQMITAPQGVIQLSGPVRNKQGHIAVAGNLGGNWDIWVYDGQWHRLTDTPSIEMDPWWEGDSLVYASNVTGKFQIHSADQHPITQAPYAAILPRQGKYLSLNSNGWNRQNYKLDRITFGEIVYPPTVSLEEVFRPPILDVKPYTPLKSIWPNYIRPDFFSGVDDLQLGITTKSRDVTGDYRLNAGFRYSFDTDSLAFRAALQAKSIGAQYTHYPVDYTTDIGQVVNELRDEIKLFWRPVELKRLEAVDTLREDEDLERFHGLELSLNWRTWKPLDNDGPYEDEVWSAISAIHQFGILRLWGNLELFSEDRQSLSGGLRLLFGDQILTSLHMIFGRAWGEPTLGHTTFRIGGNLSEGYFTRRPPKLFPVRGFDSNLVEAPKAGAAGIEVHWPLANLQKGYETLPLFLHRLRLGTFVDAGIAGEDITSDDWIVGAGFEFITSVEIAWGNLSVFRMGMAWPLVYPDFVKDDSPKFFFQLGRPL
ncbi:MAG: hypothetical protein JSV38_14345 [Desulfobacterales bacterium]|nr:MAG: hypothetical protein JSV38_14345 [Desulfobacterales bacterium]